MLPLRSPDQVLYVDGVSVERDAGGWAFSWSEPDVNSMIEHRFVLATDEVIATGPPGRMSSAALDELARNLGREPASLAWCTERRLLECIVRDDREGVRDLASDHPTIAGESILTIAIGVAAWSVADDLVLRGDRLAPPPNTIWDAASFAIAALDGSDGAARVLDRLLARKAIVAAGGLLRLARSPQIVNALIDAGADPDGARPSSPSLEPILDDATPLAAAIVHRDSTGATEDRFDVAAALLARGASLEARDAHGRTALIIAAIWGYEAPVRWLLDRGANVRCAADARGRTPKSLALARPDDPSSRLLLDVLGKR